MKLVTYSVKTAFGSVERLGALLDGEIIDLNAACWAAGRWDEGVGWSSIAGFGLEMWWNWKSQG